MSAYLVSPEHITNLADWATQPNRRAYFYNASQNHVIDITTRKQVTAILAQANLDSVVARYGADDSMCRGDFVAECMTTADRAQNRSLSPADIYNMCCCLEYQSCEVNDWASTDAYWVIKGIMAEAARLMAKCGTKPARIDWSFDDYQWDQMQRAERERIDQDRKEWLARSA
jgi:hypothetical protein